MPKRFEKRKQEAEEDKEENDEACYGGFRAWQEVAASRDIIFGNKVGVRQGTPGVLVGNMSDGSHVTVRFDQREDESELCVNVLPEALMNPLPGGFRLGQKIVALFDLMLNDKLGVLLGTPGTVVARSDNDRLTVLFDHREDKEEGTVSVSYREVNALRLLAGGFKISQSVQPVMDLIVNGRVVVKTGTRGRILAEFSETRLTVAFDRAEAGSQSCFNVLPLEIQPWCELSADMPAGEKVRVTMDLVCPNSMVIKVGTLGSIVSGVSDMRVMVMFEAQDTEEDKRERMLTVDSSSIQKASEDADESNVEDSSNNDTANCNLYL
jgi:hypothetical protein